MKIFYLGFIEAIRKSLSPPKYIVITKQFNSVELTYEVDKMQDDGWQIAGPIACDSNVKWCMDKSITIPFKKKAPIGFKPVNNHS